ncbi:MAG TPA: branched-chain amino acid ABC transporter permease [Pseudorhodoferax sp.]|nr:branched-chain amino acid ABC transporter permease [Pseudorhodoferax sp.]
MFQFLLDVLIRTADLALVAVGLSAVYALVKFPNVAHVQYATLGAFLTLLGQRSGLPFVAAALLSCLAVGAVAVLLNVLVFQRLLRSGPAIAMIGSLAVAMVLTALVLGIAGSRPLRFAFDIVPPLTLGGARVSHAQACSIAVATLVLGLFAFMLYRTPVGRSMRALASNRALSEATGIDAAGMTNLISFCSGALAAVGGTMLAMTGDVHVNLGNDLLLPVFAAAILGGLGSPLGAVAGALLIAVAETLVTNLNFGWLVGQPLAFLPVTYIGAASFLFLLIALLFKPFGLFDREVRRV